MPMEEVLSNLDASPGRIEILKCPTNPNEKEYKSNCFGQKPTCPRRFQLFAGHGLSTQGRKFHPPRKSKVSIAEPITICAYSATKNIPN